MLSNQYQCCFLSLKNATVFFMCRKLEAIIKLIKGHYQFGSWNSIYNISQLSCFLWKLFCDWANFTVVTRREKVLRCDSGAGGSVLVKASEGQHVYEMDKAYLVHVCSGTRMLERLCKITKQHTYSVCWGSEPLSAYGSAVGLTVALRRRHRHCDVAPKMPGLCTPGLVLSKNKTKWPRLFKVGISSPQGKRARGEFRYVRARCRLVKWTEKETPLRLVRILVPQVT